MLAKIERHHRDVDACAEGRDQAEDDQAVGRRRRRFAKPHRAVDTAKNSARLVAISTVTMILVDRSGR